jgi:methyl-accepting chemotaxis protein
LGKFPTRIKFFINEPAQIKILGMLLISIVVPVFFVGTYLYLLIFNIINNMPETPGFVAASLDPVLHKTNMTILLSGIPIFLLILIWGLIFSHRLVGPMKRLQRNLDEMTKKGDGRSRLIVRKNDYIKPLIESVNRLLDKVAK